MQVVGTGEVARSENGAPAPTQPVGAAKDSISALIEDLKDSDPNVRSFAAEALGKMGESGKVAIPSLILLLKDKNEQVQRSASEALGKLGYEP